VRLLVLAFLILALQIPVLMIDNLVDTRACDHAISLKRLADDHKPADLAPYPHQALVDSYRLVRRAIKYEVLVFTLIFGSLFFFEVCVGLRLHTLHYVLVAAALCLFYLILLSLVEIIDPVAAYGAAVAASVALIGLYGAAILQSWPRAGALGSFIIGVYSVLLVLLELPKYALLAGSGTLFLLLAAAMFLTRHVDWDDVDTRAL